MKIFSVLAGILLVSGEAQSPASDTVELAAVMAGELTRPGHAVAVEEQGIGIRVAAALGAESVRMGPRPVCPWAEGTSGRRVVVVVVRLMEMSEADARVHVDTTCRMESPRRGGFTSLVRYRLEKAGASWRIVARETLFIT